MKVHAILKGAQTLPFFGENGVILSREEKPFSLKITDKSISCKKYSWASSYKPFVEESLKQSYLQAKAYKNPGANAYCLLEFEGKENLLAWNRIMNTCGFTPKVKIQFWDLNEIYVTFWYYKFKSVESENMIVKLDKDSSIALAKLWNVFTA